jgi:hypothetical protein
VLNIKGEKDRLYLRKAHGISLEKPPSYFDCVTNFIQMRNTVGSICDTWRSKRDSLGPAVYFYLVTRRGLPLYLRTSFRELGLGSGGISPKTDCAPAFFSIDRESEPNPSSSNRLKRSKMVGKKA